MSATETSRPQPSTAVRIGFIGLGNMGARMARRLLAAGFPVAAYDVAEPAVASVVAAGAIAAQNPREAAIGADIVLTSLPTPDIVTEVVTGKDGILAGIARGAIVVDMSTIDPATAQRIAKRCHGLGVAFLDAPVSKGAQGAESGTLTFMVGGDIDVLDRCRPILSHLGTEIIHVGPVGYGQMAKLCNNMIAAVNTAILGEVLVTAVKAGADLETIVRILSHSSAGSHMLDAYFPIMVFVDERPARFTLDLMQKDLGLFLEAAAALGVAVPISAAASQVYRMAQSRDRGHLDMTGVVEIYEEFAGVRLRYSKASTTEADCS